MASTSLPFQEHHQPDIPSRVKVTILASEWESSKGGLSTLNRELAIQLAKLPEVEITFFLPRCSEEEKNQALSQNVKVVEAVPHPALEELDWLSFPPEDLQIDIVVGHGIKLGHQAQVIRTFKNCQWVQMVHTDQEELGMFKTYDKPISKGEEKHKTEVRLCEMADLVIGVGPKLSEAFRSYLRGFQEVRCVYDFTPGVFDEFVSTKQSHDEQKHCSVLVFGHGDDEEFELRGFDIAGRAISKLPDTRLVFVGAPDGKHEEIARKLSECGVPKRCLRVRGFVQSREELKRLFQEVDLVLMPSRTEGFGLTGLESLSAGLPVLVSGNSGFGEALCKVSFGPSFVIDSEDPEEWAAAIKGVLNKDRQKRLEEAETLRTSYGKKYNWAEQSRDLLDKMISIVHGTSDAKTDLQQLVAGTESVVKENGKRLKLDHSHAGQGVMPLEAGLQRSQSTSQISREFAYCEADITFFAARHDEDTRQWLFKDFDKWFSDPGDSRAYVLLGDAGIGKSVMAGALAQRARKTGHLGAAYFCRHNDGTRNNPRYLVGTIACQLCDCDSEISTLVGGEDGVKMMLADSKLGVKELFTKLLEEPLGKCTPCQQRKLVIIDALDETEYESREDFLYVIKKALPRLPQWLLFFITSRPEHSVQSRLEKYNPCVRICAGDSGERGFYKQHEQDIKLFLKKEIDFSYISYSVEQVTKKCNGLFLYAYYIAEVLKESNSHRVSQQTDLFPGDIDEFFEENFQRVFDKIGADLYRKLFGCIIAAPSPLPISFISYILNREKSNLDEQEAIDAVSLFVVRTADGTVKFLHNLIPMWLTDKKKAPRRLLIDKKVAVEYLRIVFIEILSTVVEETRATLPLRDEDLERFVMHIAVRFLCHHVDENSLTNVFNWLTNYRFLEKRIHSGRSEIYHVIEDFKLASSCLPAEETQQQNVLQEISVALESDFHVLVECPHLLRSCVSNTLDDVGGIFSIPQVSAPCLEWSISNINSATRTLFQCNCFATSSDKKTFAGAKDRSLFFFDASTLGALGGPFEVSRDVIQRINCLEFSPDDKFVFFGRLDKWFSVGRGCVEDFHQFSENPGHHDWGRIVSNGQHIVVKRNHFSDLPETCQTKECIEDLLSLWALKEIDGGPDKEWTCSFRQLRQMVDGFSDMGIETISLLGRLGINLPWARFNLFVGGVNAMHGSNYRSCYFCDQLKQLKELTDPSKESSLAPVRQLVIKLYRWIFRYQVWNLETGRPLLQDVFNQCAQLNPFTYFCHVTSAFDKWGKEIGCAGVDQVMSVCNIAVVTAIDTFFRLRVGWSKRTYVRLSEREMESLRECLEEWMVENRRSFKFFFLFQELGRSLQCTVMREWLFKETRGQTLKQEDWEEENKLTEMVKRRLDEVWKRGLEDSHGEEERALSKIVKMRLKDIWKNDSHKEGDWEIYEMVERGLTEIWKLKEELHGKEERELSEMVEDRLSGIRMLMKDFHGSEAREPREITLTLKDGVRKILDRLRPGLWQLIWKWTLQLDLELFCDSFKRDVSLNFPKGFLDLFGNEISPCLSPRKMWMVNSKETGEIDLLRTGFQEQDSFDYSSEKQEYRITQVKYLTFTYDDLYVVYMSHEDLVHALSLQTGTIFTSVSGRNCCCFARERRVGYLFRNGTEEKVIFLTSLLNPCKFFPDLPGQDGELGETTAAIFSSSDTVKYINSESLITSWRLVDHNLGFSFEPFSESSSVGSRSQAIKIQNCVFSTDGKLLAFQQHTQIKQCLVEAFEKSQCIVFEADFSFTDLCLTFSSDGVFLLFIIQDYFSGHLFYVWDVQGKVLSKSFSSPSLLSIDSFCLSSDNRNLVLCGGEGEIEIWEFGLYPRHLLETICVERSFNPVKFSHCAVSQDSELLVCCLGNVIFVHSLQVANIHSSKRVLHGHIGKIEFCKFLKRNRYLISYAVDGMVFLWDISESKAIGFARIAKGREKILCMAVSPDEDRAVCFISPSGVCVLHFCNLKCALPKDFFTAQRKGRISTAETSLLPVGQIPSTSSIPASRLEDDQHGGFRGPFLEEQFLLKPEDLFDSDESDDCEDYEDFD